MLKAEGIDMESATIEIWNKCLDIIRDNVNLQSFKTWFEPIKPMAFSNQVLTIMVPSSFFYEWLEEHYVTILHKTIRRVLGAEGRLEYKIVVEHSGVDKNSPHTISVPAKGATSRNPEVNTPLNITGPNIRNPFVVPGIKKMAIDPQLNPDFTFDNYVEGDCNRLARAAGIAVAEKPGATSFNPLMIFSHAGLGKTHLVHAIGNRIKELHPSKTVLYVTSEKFSSQFIDAMKSSSINDFMNFYQLLDVLLIDDVQFFAGKEKLQDMFFQVFNDLHSNGKQLIITSDRSPKDLKGLADRLLSRFKWGLSVDLQAPDLDTRISIMKMKMYSKGIDLPTEVVEFIAHNITTNIREIEGALNSLLAHSLFNKTSINLDLAKDVMKNFVKNVSMEVTIDNIKTMVCEYFELPVDLLSDKSRKREVVQARQIAMYFSKRLTQNSLKNIGNAFGGRDHSTVIHSCQTVEDLMSTDRKFKVFVDDIGKKIKMNTL